MSQSVIAEPRSDDLKVPPHNIEAEQYVIGGLLISNESWDEISDQITSDDFYRFDHRLFFESITGLADEDKPFDAVTIADWLKGRGQLRNEEWREYLIALDKNTPSAANIRHYTKTVREASMLRNLITVSNKTTALAVHKEGLAVDEVLNRAEQLIYQVSDQEVKRKSGEDNKDRTIRTARPGCGPNAVRTRGCESLSVSIAWPSRALGMARRRS